MFPEMHPKVNGITPSLVYIGFLSNCDDSILMYQLANGFITKKLEHNEGNDMLKSLSNSKNENPSQDIFSSAKKIYKKRPKLIHGSDIQITQDDLKEARHLLGEAIKLYIRMGLTKAELIKTFNSTKQPPIKIKEKAKPEKEDE
ncbi:MAG: hypothetical protein QXP07_00095 [Candidatus Parvarchaeum sp.]|nr:hypothetical protein [Candidatus Parvarchaeum tengchongense]